MRRAAPLATLLALLFAAALWWPASAEAYRCAALGCPAWGATIPVGVGALSEDLEALAPGTTVAELERAMHDWSLIGCADIPFEAPTTTATMAVTNDGVSTVAFVHADWPHDASAIGVTSFETAGCPGASLCIVEADIALNAVSYTWVTRRGALPEVNAYSIALHELGHYLGLGHVNDPDAAMHAGYTRGYLTLDADDAAGACALYPREEAPPDCALEGCPFGQACVEGTCTPTASESCVTAMDCAFDERCIPATGQCVRQLQPYPDLGTLCEVDADCDSGECGLLGDERRCTLTCDGLDTRSCPSGFYCDPTLTPSCATGYCVEGIGGDSGYGEPCAHATDCASLACSEGVCSSPCDATGSGACPAGRVCHPDRDSGCGACLMPSSVGQSCLTNAQCESGLCYASTPEADGVCSMACETDADCSSGFVCAPAGDTTLCLPPPARVRGGGCSVGAPGETGGGAPLGLGVLGLCLALHHVRRRSRTTRTTL